MSPSGKKNPADSTRDRLLALAREQGEDFQLVLIRYGLERLLYRLSHSPHHDRFVLKGAMLFMLWSRNRTGRPGMSTYLVPATTAK